MLLASIHYIAIIYNPSAGAGKAIALAERIAALLREKGISFLLFTSGWPRNFSTFTAVWIIGGDGTLNYFINQYPAIQLPLAIFPGGTGNDMHWLLYGEKTIEMQVDTCLSVVPKPVDAGICNDRLFMNGVGIGFEGSVAQSLAGKKKRPGKTSFLLAILKKIFFYRSREYSIVFAEYNRIQKQLMISVSNGKRAGGGFRIAPAAAADDGLLDITLIDPLHPLWRIRYLPVIEKGKHLQLPFVHHFRTTSICIVSDELISAHLDGEPYSHQELDIRILPGRFLFLW
jgi:YegS/Rv2252/BmrU family lipid kinase